FVVSFCRAHWALLVFLPRLFHFSFFFFLFFYDSAPTGVYTLSLHDALPISDAFSPMARRGSPATGSSNASAASSPRSPNGCRNRSEEHTSELQSRFDLVCRLLHEQKKDSQGDGAEHFAPEHAIILHMRHRDR